MCCYISAWNFASVTTVAEFKTGVYIVSHVILNFIEEYSEAKMTLISW